MSFYLFIFQSELGRKEKPGAYKRTIWRFDSRRGIWRRLSESRRKDDPKKAPK